MDVTAHFNRVTERCDGIMLRADNFEDEQILRIMFEAVLSGDAMLTFAYGSHREEPVCIHLSKVGEVKE